MDSFISGNIPFHQPPKPKRIDWMLKTTFFGYLNIMVEPLLSGIVLGLVPVTIAGLLVAAYLQYRRGDSLNF